MARFLAMVRAGLPCPRCGGQILPLHPAITAKFCLQCGCSGRVPRLAPKDDDLEGITESLWTLTLTQLLEEQVAWRKWRGCESKVAFATFEEAEEVARKTGTPEYGSMGGGYEPRLRPYACDFGEHWHNGHSLAVAS